MYRHRPQEKYCHHSNPKDHLAPLLQALDGARGLLREALLVFLALARHHHRVPIRLHCPHPQNSKPLPQQLEEVSKAAGLVLQVWSLVLAP